MTFIETVREMSLEQYEYRDLLKQMVLRDFLLRYKQTVFGFAWAVFMPLVNTIIFTVVFTRVAKIDTPVAYPLFAYCGLWAWNFFASSARFSLTSLTSNSSLVTKIYFPREIFPFSVVLVCLVDMAVAAIPLVVMMIYYEAAPGTSLVLLPMVVFTHVVVASAVSLGIAAANLFFRDVKYIFEVVLTAMMFLTAVLYPVREVTGWAGTLLNHNPLTIIIEGYRATLLLGVWPDITPLFVVCVVSLALLLLCWITFHRMEYRFAEYV